MLGLRLFDVGKYIHLVGGVEGAVDLPLATARLFHPPIALGLLDGIDLLNQIDQNAVVIVTGNLVVAVCSLLDFDFKQGRSQRLGTVYDGNIAVIKFPFALADLETAMLLDPKVGTVVSPEGDDLFVVKPGAETTLSAFGATINEDATLVKVYKKPLDTDALATEYTKANIYIAAIHGQIAAVAKTAKKSAPTVTVVEDVA